jgi:hypothetical protein
MIFKYALDVLAEVAKVLIKQLVLAFPYDSLSLKKYELLDAKHGNLERYYLF